MTMIRSQNIATITNELVTIAALLRNSTVQIRQERVGVGSGVIWRSDGLIITNAHVVRGKRAQVELADGRVLTGTVVRRDQQRDLVALQVEATDLPAATIGDSGQLRVGDLVLAMGNPLGMVGALTTGIVSALPLAGPRSSSSSGSALAAAPESEGAPESPNLSRGWIQADVQLAPGNSGGPLADAQGRVVGINSMIVNGRGWAIPSQAVQQFLQRDVSAHPYLGITYQPVGLRLNGKRRIGCLILEVEADSPAAAARLQTGDILVGWQGQSFTPQTNLTDRLTQAQSGDVVELDLLRSNQWLTQTVTLRGRSLEQTA